MSEGDIEARSGPHPPLRGTLSLGERASEPSPAKWEKVAGRPDEGPRAGPPRPTHGFSTTLMHPSFLSRKVL